MGLNSGDDENGGEGALSPERKAELLRRLAILREELEGGRIHIAPELAESVGASLAAVRTDASGQVDLSTVDGSVRAMALTMAYMRDRDDLKAAVPWQDIQREYFRLVAANFGTWFDRMRERNASPRGVGYSLARSSQVSGLAQSCRGFLAMMREFWMSCLDAAYAHLEDGTQLKAVYGGSLFPLSDTNIASRCGFYVDTVVLPDPFLRMHSVLEYSTDEDLVERVFENALAVLTYRELALADVAVPIVAILPDRMFLEDEDKELLGHISRPDVLAHLEAIFGRRFLDFDEATEFCSALSTVEKAVEAVRRPERLLFDREWTGDVAERIRRAMSDPFGASIKTSPGTTVLMDALGRMHQANDTLRKGHQLRGAPLIDAPTSWEYFRWKLEYDSARLFGEENANLHVVNAVLNASEDGDLAWLGDVPPDALIQLRKDDALPELRALFGDGVQRLADLDPKDFAATGGLVAANLKLAFAEHGEKIKQLQRKKWKFGFADVGSWLTVGGVEVAAAITGTPLYGLAGLAAHQILDVPRLKEIPAKFRVLQEEDASLKRSPVGLLFGTKR